MIEDRRNRSPRSHEKSGRKSRGPGPRIGVSVRSKRRGPPDRTRSAGKAPMPRKPDFRAGEGEELVTSDSQISEGRFRGIAIPYSSLGGSVPLDITERRSIFVTAGKAIRASRFLDLCAGTGMIGIEAISRGAMLATLVERSAKRCSLIARNLEAVGIKSGHAEVVPAESEPFLKRMAKRRRFWDIVFYDPPFDAAYEDDLRFLTAGVVIRPGGILILRHHSEMFFPESFGVLSRYQVDDLTNCSISSYKRRA